jgi:Protein of unknown function (DUF4244)
MTHTTMQTDRLERSTGATRPQRGMVTAEYAVGVVFACGLAGACLLPALSTPLLHDVLAMLWRYVLELRW